MLTLGVTRFDQCWLAGLLEGEGSFMKGSPSKPNKPKISVEMTDEDVVSKAAMLMGVSYQTLPARKASWKTSYRAVLQGQRAVELMRTLKHHMGLRRQTQIKAVLDSYRTPAPAVQWPSDAGLLAMRQTMSWRQLAKKLKCSHPAVRRRILNLMVHVD